MCSERGKGKVVLLSTFPNKLRLGLYTFFLFDHLCSGNNLHLIIMGYENGLIIFRNPFVPNALFLYPLLYPLFL